MKHEWRNDGEPVNGFYEAVVDMEDGTNPQVFRGTTHRLVADALLKAQANATKRLQELRAEQRPQPVASAQPLAHPLTAEERMQLAHDISDPDRSDAAVERILAAKGVRLNEVSELIAERNLRRRSEAAIEAAAKFEVETPDWIATAHNKQTLVNYMQAQGMQPTLPNFHTAFENLRTAGLLQLETEEPTPATPEPAKEPERISPVTTRPRTTLSTGVRAGNGSPAPAQSRPRYTKRDLDNMELDEYQRRYTSEPGFAAAVAAALR